MGMLRASPNSRSAIVFSLGAQEAPYARNAIVFDSLDQVCKGEKKPGARPGFLKAQRGLVP
jgi:hypothetical protein